MSISKNVYEEETLSNLVKRQVHLEDDLITDLHPKDDEYFERARQFPITDYGFPRGSLGVTTGAFEARESNYFHQVIKKPLNRLMKTLGANSNALTMLYPDDGYIGWHHNGNAPGYNVLFSYSMDGNGYFKYYDHEKEEIVYINDKPGWNVKCGYYPHEITEAKRVYWHAAYTKKPRLSIAFIINQRDLWINMIEYITNENFDREYLEGQGPLNDLKNAGYIE